MMNRFFYSILFVLCAASAFSQAPGYMGKRFVAGYGLYANPRLSESGGSPGVNLTHEGFLEFAMKKGVSVGASVRFNNAMYTNTRNVNVYTDNYAQQENSPNGFTTVKGRNYALYFKFYKRNYVAPWGKYFMLGATLNTFKATYDPDMMYVTLTSNYNHSDKIYYSDFGPTTQSGMRFDIMFGNGRSRVIADRIILDYGYTVNLIGMTMAIFDSADTPLFDAGSASASNYVESTSAARMRSVNKFNLFLKVGYLF